MSASAEKVKSCLVCLVRGELAADVEPARALKRLAARALRNARGGRVVTREETEDLVQEFLLKVLALRGQRGAKELAAQWEAMSLPLFSGYVRSMMKNLAVDDNPMWDVQRALREVVKAALADGLPPAQGLPSALEKSGRFVRGFVAAACAELVNRDLAPDAAALTSALMAEYALGLSVAEGADTALVESSAERADEALSASATSVAVVARFLAEVGPEGGQMLALRKHGFAEMARRLGLALSTAHGRYGQAEATLAKVARRLGADRQALERALATLSVA